MLLYYNLFYLLFYLLYLRYYSIIAKVREREIRVLMGYCIGFISLRRSPLSAQHKH